MSNNIFEEIGALLENMEGRYIIVENNRPCYVIMSFDDYRTLGDKLRKSRGENLAEANAELEKLRISRMNDDVESAPGGTDASEAEVELKRELKSADFQPSDLPF